MGKGKPRFPFSLYQMVDSGANEIGWSSDGASFWVNNPEGLASRVIPNFFDHASYPSFTRSLNAHGFLKLTPSTWAHPLFHRGKPEQLSEIGRKHADGHRPKAVSETAKLVEQERKATMRLKAQAAALEAQLQEARNELQTDQAKLVQLQKAARASKAGGPSAPFDGFAQATATLTEPKAVSSEERRDSAAAALVAVTAAVAASPRISAEDFDVAAAAASTRASGNWHSALTKVSSVLKVAHAPHERRQQQQPPPSRLQQQQQRQPPPPPPPPAPGPVLAPQLSAEPAATRPVHPFADGFFPSAAADPALPEAGGGPSRCSCARLSEPSGAARASERDRSSLARKTDSGVPTTRDERRTCDVRDLASLRGTSLKRITTDSAAAAAAAAYSGRKSDESTPRTAPSERERASRSSGCRDSGCRDSGASSCYMGGGHDAGVGLGGGVGRPRPVSVASVASDLSAMSISKLLPSPLRDTLISPGSQQGGTRAVASMSLTMSDCGLVESDLAPPRIPAPSWPPSPAGRGPSVSSDGGRAATRFRRSSSAKSMDGRMSEGSEGLLSENSAGSCGGGSARGSGKSCGGGRLPPVGYRQSLTIDTASAALRICGTTTPSALESSACLM